MMLHHTTFVLLPLAFGLAYLQEAEPPTRVPHVDLQRYVGLWHEIARIPNRFQKQCAWGVTAEYALRPDGRIDVVNRCHKKDGSQDEAKGLARVEDKETNSLLKVSFFSIFGWRPVWGDYWIIDLADDYSYAVVCSPDRKYGWILAREPELPTDVLEGIDERLRRQGFDPSAFHATPQEAPPASFRSPATRHDGPHRDRAVRAPPSPCPALRGVGGRAHARGRALGPCGGIRA